MRRLPVPEPPTVQGRPACCVDSPSADEIEAARPRARPDLLARMCEHTRAELSRRRRERILAAST